MAPERIRGLFCRRQQQGTGCGIGHIVMAAAGMVDAVFAAPRRVAFEADQLADQPLVAEQPDLAELSSGKKLR